MGQAAPAPDWTALQNSITTAAKDQTAANRPSINTPFANQSWTQGPNGEWTQSNQLAGGLGTAATSLQGQLGQAMANPFDLSQFGQAQTGDQARQQAIDAAMGQATSRLDPTWDRRMEAQRTQLLNQGLDPNSQAYKSAMQEANFARNDAYNQAQFSAIGQGTAAGDSAFRNNMMARQTAIADALRQRGMPMEELKQLSGFLPSTSFNADTSTLQGALGSGQFAQHAYEQKVAEEQRAADQAAQIGGASLSAAGGLLAATPLLAMF